MALRPIWRGICGWSLVTCPVSLYNAIATTGRSLPSDQPGDRQSHPNPGGRSGRRGGPQKPRARFEIEKDRYLLLTDEEIKSVRLESTETIDIERFVDGSEIDRIWWNDPITSRPTAKPGPMPTSSFAPRWKNPAKVALGRVVIGTRERLVAIEPRGTGMLVTTLRTHDEVRAEAPFFESVPSSRPDPRMIEIAEKIIDQQAGHSIRRNSTTVMRMRCVL